MRSTLLRPLLAGSLLFAADKAWFGLIGLAGLLGLKRRRDVRDRAVRRNDTSRSASARV